VKIDPLAKRLRVTRGSFYFHFSGLGDLQQSLLEEWRTCNCAPFETLADQASPDGLVLFTRIVRTWVDEAPFRPHLDLAIRDWARSVRTVANDIAEADERRISQLAVAFRRIGYDNDESLVRARITYFHQIGYYALSFKESAADRRRYQPIYGRVLLGPLITD
jgi:AcrR family transcriptional regulator